MRISDWSSDVCSSDLLGTVVGGGHDLALGRPPLALLGVLFAVDEDLAGNLALTEILAQTCQHPLQIRVLPGAVGILARVDVDLDPAAFAISGLGVQEADLGIEIGEPSDGGRIDDLTLRLGFGDSCRQSVPTTRGDRPGTLGRGACRE